MGIEFFLYSPLLLIFFLISLGRSTLFLIVSKLKEVLQMREY